MSRSSSTWPTCLTKISKMPAMKKSNQASISSKSTSNLKNLIWTSSKDSIPCSKVSTSTIRRSMSSSIVSARITTSTSLWSKLCKRRKESVYWLRPSTIMVWCYSSLIGLSQLLPESAWWCAMSDTRVLLVQTIPPRSLRCARTLEHFSTGPKTVLRARRSLQSTQLITSAGSTLTESLLKTL